MEDDRKEELARKYHIDITDLLEKSKERSYCYIGHFYAECAKNDLNKEYKKWARQKFLQSLKHTAFIGLTVASMTLLTMDMYRNSPIAREKLKPTVEYIESIGRDLKSYIIKKDDNYVEL